MSNVTAVRANKDELYMRGPSGVEWTLTRAQIQAIWQAQSGTPAQRKAATISAIIASAVSALGQDVVGASPLVDLDPTDTLAAMRLQLGL